MNNEYTKIKDIKHLKQLAYEEEGVECFISLGGLRSSKRIWYEDNTFEIVNEIDDSEQTLKEEELWTDSNIGEALDKGALYKYD